MKTDMTATRSNFDPHMVGQRPHIAIGRNGNPRIVVPMKQQRRDADLLHEVQSQSQAAAVSQLMEDVSSIKRQLALANRETQRRTEHNSERLDSLQDQLQAVCDDLVQARADMQGEHERTNTAMMELVEKIAEQFDAHRRTVVLGECLGQHCRDPVLAEQLAHRGAGIRLCQ